jgi:hypothetical protein
MRVIVVEGPARAVLAVEAKATGVFGDDEEDNLVQLLLDIAQAQIDGWDGWLGRAVGLQTLEIKRPTDCVLDLGQLPLPPYVQTVSDVVTDGVRTFRWKAGYGETPAKPLPAPIRHAIILMAGILRDAVPDAGGGIRRETVDGIGSTDYALPNGAAEAMRKTADNLLSTFRIFV